MVDITVLFAIFNDERVLPKTLERYVAQWSVPVSSKLVIVDNASTDGTAAILEQFAYASPFRYVTRLPTSILWWSSIFDE